MVGIDEVGRGCWAGPLLVVAARATAELPAGLRDSKLMTKAQRQKMANLLSNCCDFGEGWVSPAEIDKRGLARSMRLGVRRALRNLNAKSTDEVILDGSVNYVPKIYRKVQCIVNADAKAPIVSAASIFAKVKRDDFMIDLAKKYPTYAFDSHVGYGTKVHHQAIKDFGVITGIHRFSFKPLQLLGETAS